MSTRVWTPWKLYRSKLPLSQPPEHNGMRSHIIRYYKPGTRRCSTTGSLHVSYTSEKERWEAVILGPRLPPHLFVWSIPNTINPPNPFLQHTNTWTSWMWFFCNQEVLTKALIFSMELKDELGLQRTQKTLFLLCRRQCLLIWSVNQISQSQLFLSVPSPIQANTATQSSAFPNLITFQSLPSEEPRGGLFGWEQKQAQSFVNMNLTGLWLFAPLPLLS